MATFNKVDNNNAYKGSTLNLLRNFVFNSMGGLSLHNPSRVYNTGDHAYIINRDNNTINIIESKYDNVLGEYDENEWIVITIQDFIDTSVSKIVSISELEPTLPTTQIWVLPIERSVYNLPSPVPINMLSIIFTGEIQLVQDFESANTSDLITNDLIFDHQGISEIGYEYSDYTNMQMLVIDNQSDIHISPNGPSVLNPAFLWLDTDLEDDNI